jgi:hypothetical protein
MDLNLLSFSYLFLRLAPFILISFFTLASIFNQDFKGLVYIAGLLFSCFTTIVIGNGISDFIPRIDAMGRPEICNMVTLGQNGDISKLPLGQSCIAFTFGYLLYTIVSNKFVQQNIATIVFFPILLLFDIVWNARNSCYTSVQLLLSLVIASTKKSGSTNSSSIVLNACIQTQTVLSSNAVIL